MSLWRFGATLLLCALAACSDDASGGDDGDAGLDGSGAGDAGGGDAVEAGDAEGSGGVDEARAYEATIRWTSYGVPHIVGSDWVNASYGAGYAFAEMHTCVLADQIVKVRSERARWFGRGENDEHVNSDFGFLALGVMSDAELLFPELDAEEQAMLRAYVAGYNEFLEVTPSEDLPGWCAGEPWVSPITEIDLFAYYLNLGERSSGIPLLEFIATAQPPGSQKANDMPRYTWDDMPDFRALAGGSNGWALGSEYTANGRGMVLSNSHFPTQGDLQWFEQHVTIPGEYDGYGVSLMGVVVLNMGITEHVSWSHTVSPGPRLTGYLLDLDPDDPTAYLVDGERREMTSETYAIQVKQDDGSLAEESRTLWSTHWGPMLNVPPAGWAPTIGISFRNANQRNTRMIAQWLAMNRATNLDEFEQSFRDIGGIPWVHTVAADPEGRAFFTDAAVLPALSDEAVDRHIAAMQIDPLTQLALSIGFYLLDGGTSVNEWDETRDPSRPGLEPYSAAPKLTRTDFVSNSNDNHWMTNALEPLVGFPYLYGGERAPLTFPRTRMSQRMLLEEGAESARGEDGVFELREMLDAAMVGRAILAEVLLEDVVARCTGVTTVTVSQRGSDVEVDVQEACAALTGWDGRLELESRGAAVWREFLVSYDSEVLSGADGADELYANAFDPDAPIDTPAGLAAAPADAEDPALLALGAAALALEAAGIAPDAALGDIQLFPRGGELLPRSGGWDLEGAFSIADYRPKSSRVDSTVTEGVARGRVISERSGLTDEGYIVNGGNSWVAGMHFTDEGRDCLALSAYGQTDDPSSPHYLDQARLFTEYGWRPCLIDEDAILADPELRVIELSTAE